MDAPAKLDSARSALARHAWRDAFELLRASDEELGADELEGLAEAAWWTAQLDVCIDARQRAFELHLAGGNPRRAALAAIGLAKDHFARREPAIGMAWFRRAEKLLEGEEPCAETGWLERMRSVMALEGDADYDKALQHAAAALALAEQMGDKDLLAISLHDKGRALIGLGRVEEGSTLMDEANIAAVAGELSPFWTAAVFCNTITMCKEIADYGRAGDWTEAAKRWCERQAIAGFPGMCRVYRAAILRMRGGWSEALLEAQRAAEETASFNVGYAAEAFKELGQIHLDMGDLDAAADAFAKATELGRDPQPGFARLQLARGEAPGAWLGLERSLAETEADLHRAELLPAVVEVGIAAGRVDEALDYGAELSAIAAKYRTAAFRSADLTAQGRLLMATGKAGEAIGVLRRAVQSWREIDIPHEMARARALLAEALRSSGDEAAALLEEQAAASVTRRLAGQPAAVTVTPPAPAPEAVPESPGSPTGRFKQEGEYWSIAYRGASFLLRDSKGLRHLARLLAEPHREHHVLDLVTPRSAEGSPAREDDLTVAADDAGPVLDEAAKRAYKQRLEELREELEEAQAWADEGRIQKARGEIDFLTSELAAAVGLGGRDRKAASAAEKARLNVTRAVRSAIERIAEQSKELGDHLSVTVKTGTFCTYSPDPGSPIRWEI